MEQPQEEPHTSSKWQQRHKNQMGLDQNHARNHHTVLGTPQLPSLEYISLTHPMYPPELTARDQDIPTEERTQAPANNVLHAPFASEVMSFLSTLRLGLSFS